MCLGQAQAPALCFSRLSSAIFAAVLIVVVGAQITAKRFYPLLYWAVIVAMTLTGTALADFFDRSLGIGYLRTGDHVHARHRCYSLFLHRGLPHAAVLDSFRADAPVGSHDRQFL
jgi:hypothetical protein